MMRISSAPTMAPSTVPMPPVERGAADHRRGDRLQLEPIADRGQRRIQPQHLDDAGEAGQHRAQHEAGDLDAR